LNIFITRLSSSVLLKQQGEAIVQDCGGTTMATIRIPAPLRPYTGGSDAVSVSGSTVGEALRDLVQHYPDLENHLFDKGKLRSYVNLFLGQEDVRLLEESNTSLKEDDVLAILPSIAGGRKEEAEVILDSALRARLEALAQEEGGVRVILLTEVQKLEREFGLSRHDAELAALQAGVLPRRYLRSYGTVGLEGQVKLLRSTVAAVGLGGLGGNVVEGLARMGVGRITAIDGDTFEDHNFNRQLLSQEAALAQSKAEAACERVAAINAAVEIVAHTVNLTSHNFEDLLGDADVVVDALDRVPKRLMLQDGAQRLGIPLVHGAIAGYMGQVMTILPGDAGLRALYGDGEVPEQGAEAKLGCPAATPMMVAAWQVQETLKILLEQGELLRGRMLFMDAEGGTASILKIGR
jgi:molybdopterin/thiamine biosynthesis adenylyltransferase/molybdopterin converting factor small subunit